METEQALEQAARWQQLLCRLESVETAHVVFAPDGSPAEVHVLARAGKNAKAVARDVQSALCAGFGVEVDHKIISVAQLHPALAPAAGMRLAFFGMEVHTQGRALEAGVTLAGFGQCRTGRARGSTLPFSRRQCIAQATLEAGHAFTGEAARYELRAVDCAELSGKGVTVAQVLSLTGGKDLLGSAYTQPDADAAVVRSVLDAVNRQLSFLPQPTGRPGPG